MLCSIIATRSRGPSFQLLLLPQSFLHDCSDALMATNHALPLPHSMRHRQLLTGSQPHLWPCRTDKVYAVKTIHKKFTGQFLESHFVRRVQHEVDIYMHMGNSLNVAHLFDVYEDDSCVDLVMERCYGGELWKRIRKGDYNEKGGQPLCSKRPACVLRPVLVSDRIQQLHASIGACTLQEAGVHAQLVHRAEACRIVREVLRTISQFHANGVVIRDVKPENFLFATEEKDAHLKAIDFGIAQFCGCVPASASAMPPPNAALPPPSAATACAHRPLPTDLEHTSPNSSRALAAPAGRCLQ